jgi:hypothetical protein
MSNLELWDLRSESHRFLYYYANIALREFGGPSKLTHRNVFGGLAARLDALRTSTPRPILRLFAWRGYNLQNAATGLTGLSNMLAPGREGEATSFRVQAQRALRLPVDLKDQERVDLRERLAGKPL